MDSKQESTLRACVVPIRGTPDGTALGTGFFVGPGLIATCDHVVNSRNVVDVFRAGAWWPAERVNTGLPKSVDLALLRVASTRHEFTRLSTRAAVRDAVNVIGYPVRRGLQHEEQITAEIEDTRFQFPGDVFAQSVRLLKFKGGQVVGGFSGSPLIHDQTGRVIGIVSDSRDEHSNLGGLAVPAHVLLNEIEEIAAAQRAADWRETVWADSRGPAAPYLDRYLDANEPFFGRGAILHDLDTWVFNVAAGSRALLAAAAGQGKSSVVAHWFDRVGKWSTRAGERLRAVVVPITIRLSHAREEDVLRTLFASLIANTDSRSTSTAASLPVAELRWRIREMLEASQPRGEMLLLIVDGLDETIGWQLGENVIPSRPGDGVKILLSARESVEATRRDWQIAVGWDKQFVTNFKLEALAASDVEAAASSWWRADKSEAAALANALWRVSEGDPLLLGICLGLFDRDQVPSVNAFDRLEPGLENFFAQWWEDQAKQWEESRSKKLGQIGLNTTDVLAAAFEPLSRSSLREIVSELIRTSRPGGESAPVHDLELADILREMRRLLAGHVNTIALAHPKLAEIEWRRCVRAGSAARIDRSFATWARRALEEPALSHEFDPYLVRRYVDHVARLGSSDQADWAAVASITWRQRFQAIEDWQSEFLGSVERAREALAAAGANEIAAGREPGSVAALAALALQRTSVTRLRDRVSAPLAAEFVRQGLWTSRRALTHVLASYKGDFIGVAALSALAPVLDSDDLRVAMAKVATEPKSAFSYSESLEIGHLAEHGLECLGDSESEVFNWASALPAPGRCAVLLVIAKGAKPAPRLECLQQLLSMLPDVNTSDLADVELGKRLTSEFRADEVRAVLGQEALQDPYELVRSLGLPVLEGAEADGAALLVAWPWLDQPERESRARALLDRLEAITGGDPQDFVEWEILFGVFAERCPEKFASKFRALLRKALASVEGVERRDVLAAYLRFAAQHPKEERPFLVERLPLLVEFSMSPGDLFRLAASVPDHEVGRRLAELVHPVRFRSEWSALDLLAAVAPHLPRDLLELQWRAVGNFGADSRDRVKAPILEALAKGGREAARDALVRADAPDASGEAELLSLVSRALCDKRRPDASTVECLKTALSSLPNEHSQRSLALAAFAPAFYPLSFNQAFELAGVTGDDRQRALILLMQSVDRQALLTDGAEYLHRSIDLPLPIEEQPIEEVLRLLFRQYGLEKIETWIMTMALAGLRADPWWALLAAAAAADLVSEEQRRLSPILARITDPHWRAVAAAAMLGAPTDSRDDESLWEDVQIELVEASRYRNGLRLAGVFRRLRGDWVARASEIIRLEAEFLESKTYYDSRSWATAIAPLLPWASESAISRNVLVRLSEANYVDSATARNLLRAALAPRLLELGREDEAFYFASHLSLSGAGGSHVELLKKLTRLDQAERFSHAVMHSAHRDEYVPEVATALYSLRERLGRPLVFAICAALLRRPDTDASVHLLIAFLAPTLYWLGGEGSIRAFFMETKGVAI